MARMVAPRFAVQCERRPRMSDYRAYAIGPDGHFIKAEPMTCENDEEAIERARALAKEHPIEIWSGDRFVIRLDRAP